MGTIQSDPEGLAEHEREDAHEFADEESRLDEHERRLDEHDEQHRSHHDRLTTLEKHLGLHHEADDMRSEEERGADERHEERERRDEHLARRKRS